MDLSDNPTNPIGILSRKSKYALKALTILAREYGRGPVLISDIAGLGNLAQVSRNILLELKNDGILQSKKGKGGGYSLGHPLHQISLGHVVRVLLGRGSHARGAGMTRIDRHWRTFSRRGFDPRSAIYNTGRLLPAWGAARNFSEV
ncbi:MAG: RrF2 family transcriptional regulator [Candidatus Binataceae bacterium]